MKKKVSLTKLKIAKTNIAALTSQNTAQVKGGQINASRYDGCPIPHGERTSKAF